MRSAREHEAGARSAAGDEALVAQARDGSERAFAELYLRHARYVAGVAYRILGSDAELDDVVQQTFCDASRDLAKLREPGEFRAWVARICVHRVHKRLLSRKRWRRLTDAVSFVTRAASDPAELDEARALHRVLEGVSAELHVPWVLHEIEGETLPEVARLCDVSLATAKRRIAAADALIKRRLDGR